MAFKNPATSSSFIVNFFYFKEDAAPLNGETIIDPDHLYYISDSFAGLTYTS